MYAVTTGEEKFVVVTVDGPKDVEGKQPFTLQWPATNIGAAMDEIGLRGQCFRAFLHEHIKEWQKKGYNVLYNKPSTMYV